MKHLVGQQELGSIISDELTRVSGDPHGAPLIEVLTGEDPNWRPTPMPSEWAKEAIKRLQEKYRVDEST